MKYQWSFNLLLWSSCTVYTLDMFFSMGLRLLLFMLDMHLYLFWRDMHAYCIVSDPGNFWFVVIIFTRKCFVSGISQTLNKSHFVALNTEHWTLWTFFADSSPGSGAPWAPWTGSPEFLPRLSQTKSWLRSIGCSKENAGQHPGPRHCWHPVHEFAARSLCQQPNLTSPSYLTFSQLAVAQKSAK